MNKLLLITTKGCTGCEIADRRIQEALENTSREIEYVKVDVSEVDIKFIKEQNIKDFPCTVLMVDGVVKCKKIGTYPAIVLNRYIDIYFK